MDNYNIVKVLGEGSFGSALLVEDITSNTEYVIKKVPLFNLNEKEKVEAMKEVEVLSQMKHPNIISYHKSFVENDSLYIVTDYCDGGDLYSKIRAQKGSFFNEDQILDWFVQICLAIKHVHDRRILHRDIKTQNIFLTNSGIAKLGDFGIARILNTTSELARTCIGTPYYLSPEICQNKPYNNKSDVWSLGCVLYELITLKHAFEAKNLKSLIFKILKGSLPQIPDIYSPELKQLLAQIFVRNPYERPSVSALLRKPIILERICKFLNESKMKAEFNKSILSKESTKTGSPSSLKSNKIKITDPAAKYGMSVARKKLPKQEAKKVFPTNVNFKKQKQDNISTVENRNKNVFGNHMGSHSRSQVNKSPNKVLPINNPCKEHLASAKFCNSNKSIIDLSSIEFCEASHKINFPSILPTESTLSSEGIITSDIASNSTERSIESSYSNPSLSDSNYFDQSFQKTAIEVNLPDIQQPVENKRSKWSRSNSDFLQYLPLESTGSEMERTTPDDRVIVFRKRPHSAPHVRQRPCFKKLDVSSHNYSSNSNLADCKSRSNFNLNSEDSLSCEDKIENLGKKISTCQLNKKLVCKQESQDSGISFDSNELTINAINNGFLEIPDMDNQEIQKVRYSNKTFIVNFQSTSKKTFEENKIKNQSLKQKKICLPYMSENLSTNKFEVENLRIPLDVINETDFYLPLVEDKNESMMSCDKTYLLKKEHNSNIGVKSLHLPTLSEEYGENLNHTNYLEETKVTNSNSSNNLKLTTDTSEGNLIHDSQLCNKNLNLFAHNKVEIGVQCDIISTARQEFDSPSNEVKSSIPFSPKNNCDYLLSQSVDYHDIKASCKFHSLPDLSVLNVECDLQNSMQDTLRHSSISLNNKIIDDDSKTSTSFSSTSSHRLDNSDEEDNDDLYRVCQSLRYILRQSHKFDTRSICSSCSMDENNDIFSDVEQIRVDLENKIGLKEFMEAYKKMHSLIEEGDNIFNKEKDSCNGILKPGFEHLANDILHLIIKEEIYKNTSEIQ